MSSRRPAAKGFTLLELLVVILLIGIIANFAVLSIGSRTLSDRMETEAERIKQLIELAAEEAQVKGLNLGLIYEPEAYGFLVLGDGGIWSPYAESGPFRRRALGEPLEIDLRVENQLVPPHNPDDEDAVVLPQVLILSSGEVSPFELDLRADSLDSFYHLDVDGFGRAKLSLGDPH